MVSRRTDRLLHLITHHTNLEQPYSANISGEDYPAQDSERLGRTVTLKYKNRYESDFSDAPVINVDDENDNIYESEFIILRLDLSPPFKVLFLSTDYKVMLVGDSRTYLDENKIFVYPKQIEEYIGLYLNNQYYDTPNIRLKGVLFSCDSTEPGYGIIAEFYRDNSVRFLLDTEVQSICFERHKLEPRDYNGLNPKFNPNPDPQELEYIDLNGAGVRDFGPIFKDIDGGFPDPLSDMYKVGVLTLEEVCELRGKIIAERTIYGSPGIYPRHVELNVASATLYRGETIQLEAVVTSNKPKTRSIDQTVTWKSSDETIATVDQNGLVTSVGSGIAKIYAISYDAWGRCIVDSRIHVSSITLEPTSLNIIIGEQRNIYAEVLPEEATDKRVSWSSSDPSVITVRSGKVKAISPGTATITATTKEGELQATCDVSVFSNHIPVESVRIKNISGNPKQLSLATNDPNVPKEFIMEVEVLPEDATNKEVYGRAVNPYKDFAVYVEKISETNFRIKALCYCCEHKNIIEIRSNENPSIKDSVEVYVNTKLEEVVLSDTEVNLDPDFETSINTHLDLDINFLPNNKGIYPSIITGVNKEQVLSVMDTLEVIGQNDIITAEDSYLNNNFTSNRISINSGNPGVGYIRVTDIVSGQVKQCKINVGSPISKIVFENIPNDWSKIKPEDTFTVNLNVDPYYWFQYPNLYNITWQIINGNGNIEIYNHVTYIIVKVINACENVIIRATANNGLSAEFIIPEIVS